MVSLAFFPLTIMTKLLKKDMLAFITNHDVVICTYNGQIFFCKQGGFYSLGIKVERRVTQGDVDSPIIFNLIIDAVLRKIKGDVNFGK